MTPATWLLVLWMLPAVITLPVWWMLYKYRRADYIAICESDDSNVYKRADMGQAEVVLRRERIRLLLVLDNIAIGVVSMVLPTGQLRGIAIVVGLLIFPTLLFSSIFADWRGYIESLRSMSLADQQDLERLRAQSEKIAGWANKATELPTTDVLASDDPAALAAQHLRSYRAITEKKEGA